MRVRSSTPRSPKFLDRSVSSPWANKGLAPLSPCSLVKKGSLGSASAHGNLRIARPLGGELLPAVPLQPCAEAPSGRGHVVLLLDWVNLAPGHYAMKRGAVLTH